MHKRTPSQVFAPKNIFQVFARIVAMLGACSSPPGARFEDYNRFVRDENRFVEDESTFARDANRLPALFYHEIRAPSFTINSIILLFA